MAAIDRMKTTINYLLKQLSEGDLENFQEWKTDNKTIASEYMSLDQYLTCDEALCEAIESAHFAIVALESLTRKAEAMGMITAALKHAQ